jgi:hypothetical protein
MMITTNTDLFCVDLHEYCKITLQNRQEKRIRIPEGSPLLSVYISKVEMADMREMASKRVGAAWTEKIMNKNLAEVRDALCILDPDKIRIGNIAIQLPGIKIERTSFIDDLRGFENNNLYKSSPKMENLLPTMDINTVTTSESGYSNETQAMLAADLIQNNRLSLETLIKLQSEEDAINKIKENLVGNPSAYNTFILKSGLVCKSFTVHHIGVTHLGLYVPTVILRAIIQYIHRRSLHTSVTQTHKEFSANYYHPNSLRETRKVCSECVICTQSRNMEKRDIPIGRERTLKPDRPREGISADILYFPK